MPRLRTATLALCLALAAAAPAAAGGKRGDLKSTDRHVGVYVFHWFTPDKGQVDGVWHPLEGRKKWDGSVAFWVRQLKDIMASNVDFILVHLIDEHEEVRLNLFRAYNELLNNDFAPPPIVPFLDAPISFFGPPKHHRNLDLSKPGDRDIFCAQYVRFFKQYEKEATHPEAKHCLATMDGKPVLGTWAVKAPQAASPGDLTREHMEAHFKKHLGARFEKGFFLMATEEGLKWGDELNRSFVGYTGDTLLVNGRVAAIVPGRWDKLDRFQPRNGGQTYTETWERVLQNRELRRVLIESWNEYTEGTGLFRGDPRGPFRDPGYKPHRDSWGKDPDTYIRITAEMSAKFNSVPDLDAEFVRHNLPKTMKPKQSFRAEFVVRNTGDAAWTSRDGYRLALQPGTFSGKEDGFSDHKHEVKEYGGLFRGRPVEFEIRLKAPDEPGDHTLRLQMRRGDDRFGDELAWPVKVGD